MSKKVVVKIKQKTESERIWGEVKKYIYIIFKGKDNIWNHVGYFEK